MDTPNYEETPRTDAAAVTFELGVPVLNCTEVVNADFARQLEREAARQQEALAEAQKEKQPPLVIHNLLGKVADLEARLAECERLLADFRTLYPDVRMLHDGFLVNSDGGSDWDKTVATKFMRLGIRIDTAMPQNGGSDERKLNASE